jgi:hypothetical protein
MARAIFLQRRGTTAEEFSIKANLMVNFNSSTEAKLPEINVFWIQHQAYSMLPAH